MRPHRDARANRWSGAAVVRAADVPSLLPTLAAPAAASIVQRFNNTGAITIHVHGNATPYPSSIPVSGRWVNVTGSEVS